MAPSALTIKNDVADGYRQVASGWHKWRKEFKVAGASLTQEILAQSHIGPGMRALDIGCGVGEPAHRLASEITETGYVVAIDLVLEMVSFASKVPAAAGQADLGYAVADGEALPFGDRTFDAVTCRGAIMHFPAPQSAVAEAYRVLRPEGRAVFSALGSADDTPAYLTTIAVIQRYQTAQPGPAPGLDPYRFGVPGTFSTLLSSAGFRDVHEVTLTASCPWPGTAEHFWHALGDHAWHFAQLLQSVPPELRDRVAADAIAALRKYEEGGILHLTAPVIVASGAR
jgi:ubiquinone/menaquinone biosynthesis C-methylase UbiE